MLIKSTHNESWLSAYNIRCQSFYRLDECENPFALTACAIDPFGQTAPHRHDDQEMFLITSGTGSMSIDGETKTVSSGDVVFIPKHSTHFLTNSSSSEPLFFYSIAWLAPSVPRTASSIVIPAPPTPNGPLHLGHLSGPYLSADVYSRYHNLRALSSLLYLSTDDHQSYIVNKARALSLTPIEVVDKFKREIHEGFAQFLVDHHALIEPLRDIAYKTFIENFFARLIEKNVIREVSVPSVYDNETKQFVFGADVIGLCPNCKSRTCGQGCEACGHYNDAYDLIDLELKNGHDFSIIDEQAYSIDLNEHKTFLSEFIDACAMHPRQRKFYQDYLHKGLPKVTASHAADFGIIIRAKTKHVIYEWIEMAGAYAYYVQEAASRLDKAPRDLRLVEAFGFDNSFFYGFLVPALIHAYDDNLPAPKVFLTNYFYLLDHEKFSTSRQHAIWANDSLKNYSADTLRFYLAYTRAENKESNFSHEEFIRFMQKEIFAPWKEFFHLLNDDLRRDNHISIPQLAGYQERFLHDAHHKILLIHECLGDENFSLNHFAKNIKDYQSFLHDFYERHRSTTKEQQCNLSIVLSALSSWIYILTPLMPKLANNLRQAFPYELKPFVAITDVSMTMNCFDLSLLDRYEEEIGVKHV